MNNWTTGPLTVTRNARGNAEQRQRAWASILEARSHQGFGLTGLGLPKELFQRYKTACQVLGF